MNRHYFRSPAGALLLWLSFSIVFPQAPARVAGIVSDSAGRPVAGASVTVVESGQNLLTAEDGRYEFRLAGGRYTLVVTKIGFHPLDQPVEISPGGSQEVHFELTRILLEFGDEVVVVGSRARRTAVETPVPVDVLSDSEIREMGFTETSRIIQFLAPSFNFSTSTISDGTDIIRPSTLRGLGPDQTLVLVNGKRRHTSALVHVNGSVGRGSAGVDLNAIPASAIKRIEILRDGASAQYGSDAIAGVINIILKDETDYSEIDLSAGQTYDGDGETFTLSSSHGAQLGRGGFLHMTAEYRFRDSTNRAGADPRQQFLSRPDGSPDPRELTFDRNNHLYGDAEAENVHFFFNSQVGIGELTDLYFFGGASRRGGESGGFYRRALDSRNVPAIHPEGFLPLIQTDVEDFSGVAGLRHIFGSWALDTSLTAGSNTFEYNVENSVNASLGAASPTRARAGQLGFDQLIFNFDLFGSFQGSLKRPITLAFGAEVRRDHYRIEAGEPSSYIDGGVPDQFGGRAAAGIQVFPGFRPGNQVDESRTSIAAYADAEFSPSRNFLLAVAGRAEHYSDFGGNFSGKIAARYQFSREFAARASVSSGFRAPSLHQFFFNNTSTQFIFDAALGDLVPSEVGTFRNDGAVARGFGIPKLDAETSVSYSAGFTLRPGRQLSLTADFFRTEIDDRIVLSGLFRSESDPNGPIRSVLNPLGVSSAQFFSNAIDTRTEGIDLVLAYFVPISEQTSWSFTAAANWNRTDVVGAVKTPPLLAGLGETLFDRIERERVEYAQPRALYNISPKFEHNRFTGLIRFNYFGNVKTVESAADPTIDQVFRGKWLTDLEASYRFRKGFRLAVGANNVFNVYPDENRTEISFNGIFIHPRRTAPFGFNGGFWYARLSWKF